MRRTVPAAAGGPETSVEPTESTDGTGFAVARGKTAVEKRWGGATDRSASPAHRPRASRNRGRSTGKGMAGAAVRRRYPARRFPRPLSRGAGRWAARRIGRSAPGASRREPEMRHAVSAFPGSGPAPHGRRTAEALPETAKPARRARVSRISGLPCPLSSRVPAFAGKCRSGPEPGGLASARNRAGGKRVRTQAPMAKRERRGLPAVSRDVPGVFRRFRFGPSLGASGRLRTRAGRGDGADGGCAPAP